MLFKPKFPLKILGNSEEMKLQVQAHAFTKVAQEKIEAAGGSCEVVIKIKLLCKLNLFAYVSKKSRNPVLQK